MAQRGSAADFAARLDDRDLLGVVWHAMGQGLTTAATGRVLVGAIGLVILAQPPFSALLAWFALGETMSALQLIGVAVILTAVLLARRE